MGSIRIADGACINDIRIVWINNDAVNIPGFFKPHSFPGSAGIHCFIYAFTQVEGISWLAFAGAYPYYIWL